MYNKKQTFKRLRSIMSQGQILVDEPLKNHTSFKIGGIADFVVLPTTLEEVVKLALYFKESGVKNFVLGNGTNVLADDKGFAGVVMVIANNYNGISADKNTLQVLAGTGLDHTAAFACASGLKGLEEASGIPGTLGGAVIMNASAFGFETSQVVAGVLAMVDAKITYFTNKECNFAYRKSVFNELKNVIILRVDLNLEHGQAEELLAKREEIVLKRKANQPLEYPSAGCVFKRLDGVIVSKLIDEQGFKGVSVNDAQVSTKHAGFIINTGNATSHDVKLLIKQLKTQIYANCNVQLEEEIKYLE